LPPPGKIEGVTGRMNDLQPLLFYRRRDNPRIQSIPFLNEGKYFSKKSKVFPFSGGPASKGCSRDCLTL